MAISTTPDAQAEIPQDGIRYPEGFPYKDRKSAEARLGMELDKARTMIQSDEGRRELIENLNLNGGANEVLDGIDLNVEQLKKKESFFKKMLKMPGKMTSSALNLMKKHPIASILALLALAAGGIGVAAWKAPAIMTWLGEMEMAHAGTALGKAAEYLKSFSDFSFGVASNIPEGGTKVLPFDA